MELTLLLAVLTMGGLGFIFAGGLAIADKKLRVEENPLIGQINEILPGANCGACGQAGCYDFAVNVVEGKQSVNGCPVGGEDTAQDIAEIMGVEAGTTVKEIPRVMCKGGDDNAVKKLVEYHGAMSCAAMDIVSGGDMHCLYGCLGQGDCVEVCPFDALIMNSKGIPEVIPDLCTSCTMCVKECPRDVIVMHPVNRDTFVFCNNRDDAKKAKEVCNVACTACGACARKVEGLEVVGNLAEIDYEKLNADDIPFEKCKTGAIQRIDTDIFEGVK